jgi:N-acetylglutamate synthase-like GNAT family acetyltransferase
MNIICKQWTEDFCVYDYHIEDILSLIKEAYGERAKEGISYATLSYTIDRFIAERTDSSYWFLAFDKNNYLHGTARLTVKGNWGEICNFAVIPDSQGKHVGSQLLKEANQFAKEHQMDYVMSCTAINAVSSVRCHCKNGFQIVGIGFNLNKNYSSYVFRNQLTPSIYWRSAILVKLRFLFSYMILRIVKKSNGSNTMIGRFILFVKKRAKR